MRQREGATEGTREGKGNSRRRKEKDDESKEREGGGDWEEGSLHT